MAKKDGEKVKQATLQEKYDALKARYNALFADYLRACREMETAGFNLQGTSRAKGQEVIQKFKPE